MPLLTHGTIHSWMTELNQQGLVIAPVVMDQYFPRLQTPPYWRSQQLRDKYMQFQARLERSGSAVAMPDLAPWLDVVLYEFLGHEQSHWRAGTNIPAHLSFTAALGDHIRPQRLLFQTAGETQPALPVFVETARQLTGGRGRTQAAKLVEYCRGLDLRLALLTNGVVFRLYYVGLDHEAWLEWDTAAWFESQDLLPQLHGFLTLLGPEGIAPRAEAALPLRDAALASRTRQSDLSATLGEQVREAIELLLGQVDIARRTQPDLLDCVATDAAGQRLDDGAVRAALYQAATRVAMRLVVTLFAEARNLLPRESDLYRQSYGLEGIFELLGRATRSGRRGEDLNEQSAAWPRLLALFQLIYRGSAHPALTLPAYGGALFRPGEPDDRDPIDRALAVLEEIRVPDGVVYAMLRKLKIGQLRVQRGRAATMVSGVVDFTDLRTEYIGIMYEGLLDYELRAAEDTVVFLKIGNEPALPLARLEALPDRELQNLFAQLEKEAKTATHAVEEDADTGDEADDAAEEDAGAATGELAATSAEDAPAGADQDAATGDAADADLLAEDGGDPGYQAALAWARRAVVATRRVRLARGRRVDPQEAAHQIDRAARALVGRTVNRGEFYLVRESGTRKGSGTFYTKPALAVPTAIRTLEPLAYQMVDGRRGAPRPPREILNIKVVDPACGSASFLVAALHFLTDALWLSLQYYNDRDLPPTAWSPTGEPLPTPPERVTNRYIRAVDGGRQTVLEVPDTPSLLIGAASDSAACERMAQARLRRLVVERCIHGVDLNPVAVELARLSLWIETLDPDLPFTFLDHKIKVGNALVGGWLDTFQEYPLAAWLREGGDKDHKTSVHYPADAWTKAIKKRGDQVKTELADVIRGRINMRLQGSVDDAETVRLHRAIMVRLEEIHGLATDSLEGVEERTASYRAVRDDPAFLALRDALDLWCALWFWPADQLALAPTPLQWHAPTAASLALARQIAAQLRCFHWEIEFPEVFTPDRHGFDAVVGNPPWDTQKPDSREFFIRLDPIYRTYNKQEALTQQRQIFAREPAIEHAWLSYSAQFKALSNWTGNIANAWGDPNLAARQGTAITLKRGLEGGQLHTNWRQRREDHAALRLADQRHPFQYQGSADLNTYKMFAELAHALLRSGGRLGLIVPSSLGTDKGSKDLRELFLEHCRWEWEFIWMNTRKIFDIDGRYKFGAFIIEKGGQTSAINAAYNRADPLDWEHAESCPGRISMPTATIRRLSPFSAAIVEPGTQRDLDLLEKLYQAPAVLLGDTSAAGWGITYTREFDMTNDSGKFHPRPWWEEHGYRPDAYGRWVNDAGAVALPLYEGRMVGRLDFAEKGWVEGTGRRAVWREIDASNKVIEPQFLMEGDLYATRIASNTNFKLAMMSIGSASNARSMCCSIIPSFPCGHSLSTLSIKDHNLSELLRVAVLLNTFSYDFTLRQRLGGINISYFIIAETPVLPPEMTQQFPLAQWAARLTLIHPLWAREWLALRQVYPEFGARPWRAWWATDAAERLRLRCMIDAVVAAAWGLDEDDMAWLLRDDPTDPKGFWRVDKGLPYAQRQTGLTLRAFQDLQRVGIARFCREEWWGVPGCQPPAAASADDIAAGWDECARHARILAATDPLARAAARNGVRASGGDGSVVDWGEQRPEQGRLFEDGRPVQGQLGEEQ